MAMVIWTYWVPLVGHALDLIAAGLTLAAAIRARRGTKP
jgi:hypothetical protein